MIKNKLKSVNDRIDDSLRSLLGSITPDGRIIIVLVMLFIFGGASIYMTVSSIYNMGKNKGRQIQIEHIERLELQQRQKTDSITNKKNHNYE